MEFGCQFLGEGQMSICVIASYCQPLGETRQLAGGVCVEGICGRVAMRRRSPPSLPPPPTNISPPLGLCIRPRAGVCDTWGRNRRMWSSSA